MQDSCQHRLVGWKGKSGFLCLSFCCIIQVSYIGFTQNFLYNFLDIKVTTWKEKFPCRLSGYPLVIGALSAQLSR